MLLPCPKTANSTLFLNILAKPIQEIRTPCVPSPCGANAICKEQNGAGSCTCLPDYIGNPYEGCRPECVLNSDCPSNRACIRNKCQDPCPGTCGQNADCQVVNHLPSCTCRIGFTGDPFGYCSPVVLEPEKPTNPCNPSPCGPNSQCREVNGQAVCSCLPEYVGSPPGCRPECVVSSECPHNKACINQKCIDPCPGTCGLNAKCEVINHSPICSCTPGYTGDPFTRCYLLPPPPPPAPEPRPVNPCIPSPCGPNSECRNIGETPSCSCLSGYTGSPPNCRPECVINSECPSNLACIREKCRDPCPGSCGVGAHCSVINHTPICTCPDGYTGDPFNNCYPKPPTAPVVEKDPCNPSPCGPNAQCNDGVCTCLPEYQGDPYRGCRPECVLNADCSKNRACIRNKCVDPCPGTCGQNAECVVINHIPTCTCLQGFSGNAFILCSEMRAPPVTNLCNPSPCGPNSQCREINGQAVCSCVPGFIGSPPSCRPECVVSSECQLNEACVNQKCIDPCPGTCGIGAICQVVNHNPICSCPARYSGDPFTRCLLIPEPVFVPEVKDPCNPSPCGPYSQCKDAGGSPSCSCLSEYIGTPPNCKPECVSNSECPSHLACINQKCKDPCPGTCGVNAECRVISHTPNCICSSGYTGDPFVQCNIERLPTVTEQLTPCIPSPCGANAICKERNGAGACTCREEYIGNPYEGCRPECVLNSDCPSNRACINNKCQDPCPGTCGQNADCQVINHLPSCVCRPGFTGDPFRYCNPTPPQPVEPEPIHPCQPSPCGPNSQCREVNNQAVCSCLPNYIGSPPGCRPECVVSSECPLTKACVNQKCIDPCPGTCGLNTRCEVINHSPICSCNSGFTGDPFSRCYPIPPPPPEKPVIITDPCVPSPCGHNSQCRDIGGTPSCSCLVGFIGSPPNCKPECTVNSECPSNLACIREKCRDPCPGSCGVGAQCSVINHTPICVCPEEYTGDPFSNCYPKPPQIEHVIADPCNPSPCGANAQCNNGICTCLPEYQGDPYRGCRPECVLNTDCAKDKACLRNKCVDPCPGTCGTNAQCVVINHIPTCSCTEGFTGNAFILCTEVKAVVIRNPCSPSPCGPNSQCREINEQAVCSCVPGFIGSPPTCRPECVVSSECSLNEACVNQKCIDPCPGTCGVGAICQVVNHNPICSCPPRFTGDPFVRCLQVPEVIPVPTHPCTPSPCGPNSQCIVSASTSSPSCSCLPEFNGSPPNCRPECVSNSECPSNLACINQKCKDPCPGTCGVNAECRVISHTPNCVCAYGHVGNPFVQCEIQKQEVRPVERPTPCIPSPCGANAQCREQNGAGACACLPDYIGNPYEGCRPECILNSDCPSNKACIRTKCQDPCPGTCGQNADCHVINHLPSCTCKAGFTGDPFRFCNVPPPEIEKKPVNPCNPSPCGPNSQCREVNEQAVCSCLPNYVGSPPGCRPECTVSSECPLDKACVNQKCVDPCPGTCGLNAKCAVINHSPICSCNPGNTGDPFTRCYPLPPPPAPLPEPRPINPCVPSPCGPNSQCHDIGGSPSCSCLSGYSGSPPNCRPECTINSECPSNLACIREKCRDPCPGSCGINAHCSVINHTPICTCPEGYTGDPFNSCHPKPPPPKPEITDPCNPSPCGPNAQCNDGVCTCLPEYQGDPYRGCRPECVLNTDCPKDKACIRNKCVDPCPGTCGQNAECVVINHIPTCTCLQGFSGNAFVFCNPYKEPVETHPCSPSPCGPNSQCREINGQAVCSCVPGYIGSPPACRPECVVSSECPLNEACVNQKCIDPCPGTCGIGAVCQVVNHNPICSCPPRYTGDPFTRCQIIPETPEPPKFVNPCQPSPCGPNSQCKVVGADSPSCSCLPEFTGSPPNCRPECVSNSECPSNLACINQKCKDPCPGTCGINAECRVVSHTPNCICMAGFVGDPFRHCGTVEVQIVPEVINPCFPSPCGANAVCREQNRAGSCTCLPDYIGNPYEGCRPECILNSDCPSNRACIKNKCQDPCPGTCGQNADCQVINHLPSCTCRPGFTGDPFRYCSVPPPEIEKTPLNPCHPSPCGPNSQCREVNEQAVCSCLPNYIGSPPGCRPECTVSSECPLNKACINQKCEDPCPGTCGLNARCEVINHSPICSCNTGHTGDPFSRCYPIPPPPPPPPEPRPVNPCVPSPCGPYSICQDIGGAPSCSCVTGYSGSPPNCRPECTINSECPSNKACIREKCRDPCPGSCGVNAQCSVINHTPICTCPEGYIGDPFTNCQPAPPPKIPDIPDPCNPSPCGPNAQCANGICTCLPEYQGDPYRGCRPECVLNTDCAKDRACVRNKCIDPCPGTCGQNAECVVINHIPTCTCLQGFSGNAFVFCTEVREPTITHPCSPSPCGPNSQCREINGQAVCSCVPGYIGSPPTCRPECVVSSECPLNEACVNQKCIDPCPGTCGVGAICHVVNHNPICSCPQRYEGDPFTRCLPIREVPLEIPRNPCQPSPCGPNAQCKVAGDSPSCSCLPEFIGAPPNCRPECVSNSECPSHLACINQKCKDPCPGTCGQNAECRVVSHTPNCVCVVGHTGDPFRRCFVEIVTPPVDELRNPCFPSPCGANAVCKERNGAGSCSCLPEYIGNPYEGCRPECILNSDCPSNKACIRNKCQDPCPGTCGQNADCQVINHLPSCTCRLGYTGDPFTYCSIIPPPKPEDKLPINLCTPSPCGPNSQCREVNDQVVCSCLPNYIGSPPGCRPECTVSSECPLDKACINQKCIDPCPGTCGLNARCEVINHSPICSCNVDYTGDAFTRCFPLPPPPPKLPDQPRDPCRPSPCGPNAQCRDIGGTPSCSCVLGFVGSPPNCRPECTVNSECQSNKACIREKCRDPCPGSCGLGAQCSVINHTPICTCPDGYTGDPFNNCFPKPPPPRIPIPTDPCNPYPCGPNAECSNGICTCIPEYHGDPYRECRPECVLNADCPRDKACIRNKCVDPCPGVCGQNAECAVINHVPSCNCLKGYSGDPFSFCRKHEIPPEIYPCRPSPCGPNSQCREINNQAVCSCLPGYFGSPPACKPECVVSSECPLNEACVNQKCIDPCPGTCGFAAICQVINHNPICSCPPRYTGDPFTRCQIIIERIPEPPVEHRDPCYPSPCGPNSQCTPSPDGNTYTCSCLQSYTGAAPYCRPECVSNSECPTHLACINQKCRDPCPGSCGLNAECRVVAHVPNCICIDNYFGDPFTLCSIKTTPPPQPPQPRDPCYPSPCGPNAHCRVENGYSVCECIPEYRGNPYEGCRPECLANSDCPMSRACIQNKCQDPCPGTCGIGAQCTVSNHIPICSCPDGYSGDAFRQCIFIQPKEPEPIDPCNPSPCGLNTICRVAGGNAICECVPGFQGNPTTGGCRPECTISADCPRDKACSNSKCIDPCPAVCGFGAVCHVINHSPVCSCPAPLVGDPFNLCKEQPPEPKDPCYPSPCRSNGQCRVVNGAAVCTYPECVINQDCPRDKACYSQKCRDPCADACGLNALCQAVNHKAICSCPAGYVGSPEVQCIYTPELPKPECTQDSECANDKACINQNCLNPCVESSNVCGHNADCRVQLHRAVCICKDGFSGNAQSACFEIGCRSDTDCPWNQACVNRECVDPCSYTQCGLSALCRADSNHRAHCYCPDNFRGDAYVRCERPECVTDDECPFNLACQNERCEDPCNCGVGALCTVNYHRAQCSCPPGYTGNPLAACNIEKQVIPLGCRIDADCASKLACFSGVCQNPCIITKPCGINAECSVVDTLPLRTMSCLCLPGYVGDADVECKRAPQEEPGCKSNDECSSSEACLNRQCVNPCVVGNLCSLTAECHPANHKAVCRCRAGLVGDPFVRCYEVTPQPQPECTIDSDCPGDKACTNQRCQDPCIVSNPCGFNAQCRATQHRPLCFCPDGWGGNPQQQCYKPECKADNDCPYNKACVNENCINPCTLQSCGRGAECTVTYHQAKCQCPGGTQGNPLISCIAGICQYNEDCADHEACDRLNRVCKPACDDDTCASTATCIGRNHQPHCSCPPGTTGNPYVQCSAGRPEGQQPECRSDSDCPSLFGCINAHCQNPCAVTNICNPDQECRVLDTLPLRTVYCQCPPDTVTDNTGHCRAIIHQQPQCHVDSDCSDREKCIQGRCIEACRVDVCGINALCNSIHHQAICTCAPGYVGNPHVECTNTPRYPIPLPVAECYTNDDCTYDKSCKNERCVNPCVEDKPCATGAFCSVNKHQPVCICPSGYEGNPRIECIPPFGPSVGCKSNSECAGTEACVNTRCVSPCNCGPHAECKVTNHYPICYCNPGYSGNPQTGCVKLGCQSDNECSNDLQCYNGQCINPCVLGDPCASTAECYGSNHRAACRCPSGYSGNAFDRCERIECRADTDCPNNRACIQQRCIDPCSSNANPPCAQNALCYVQNHAAGCVCPPHLPEGNPLAYCAAPVIEQGRPECELDIDCPSKLACIKNTCVNPCLELSPCHRSAHCSVLDTIPVRTMICTCPDGWVPNENGECHAIIVPVPPGCTSDDDCPGSEACINRLCRNPCNCGTNTACFVQNHRPTCSCEEGFEGNPNIVCHKVGCRSDSECDSGKACINSNCINPCLVRDSCGANAECYVYGSRAECRCLSGYRGNPLERCIVVGCRANSDCPGDRQCINAQCINPCIYDNPCSPRAECKVQNHMALCRCPPGYVGNPFVECRREPQPECREDPECPPRLACINNKCQDPCGIFEPCHRPAECEVVGSVPVRTMICICPPGYISSGSGTCNPTTPVKEFGICLSDSDCPADKACFNGICRNPCNCGPNADCRIKDHKPVCTCKQGFDGNPEIECTRIGCRTDDECSGQHSCINRQCIPVCAADGSPCGTQATCYGANHRAICECPPGLMGNPKIACILVGCRSNSDCPTNRACINQKCENPCTATPCDKSSECRVYNHQVQCTCPPGYATTATGCRKEEEVCRYDSDCPSQTACLNSKCVNPCEVIKPCGVNAKCKVLDTEPVRTMVCECLPGHQGNAAVQCDPIEPRRCRLDKGFILTPDGKCECPPSTALNENDECIFCQPEKGLKIDERGRCVCALERGMIIDERGNCVCPVEYGYRLDVRGNCVPVHGTECEKDDECPDDKFCNPATKTCDNPCITKRCGVRAYCNATHHQAACECPPGYTGNPDEECVRIIEYRTVFPKPEMVVSCLSDGVQVAIHIAEQGFNGILYVKGHSKEEECRRVITVPSDTKPRDQIFKVQFGSCGLIHVNGQANFVLVIQKHPKLVTYKAQAYHIKCIYQTGEQNVTLGFNVSMLTTAGTIANTGPPPTCIMKIVTHTGQEVDSAEIGDNLMLQVEVQPGSIYGGFARSCIAKTMGDNVENEYTVTDENGCATDPTIFGEWEYNADTQSLLASFNAFKFPSSDNIRFQCNIRVCFGRCQPVNCRGYNAYGRRKRAIDQENNTDLALPGDLINGQMREEITIQSNAILTFERREERFIDPTEAPNTQRVEDICVSMIGFIIALVITALLALVAVAVAVSCWLMAYRRRPKTTGPLPHPPEFPNPLFTTPEPMAEPSPDYLT